MSIKFPGSHKIVGTIYSDMTYDESLRVIYANIAESKCTKKLDTYMNIIANTYRKIENRELLEVPNRYSNVTWDEALKYILERLPSMYSNLELDVAKSIIIDVCRKSECNNEE